MYVLRKNTELCRLGKVELLAHGEALSGAFRRCRAAVVIAVLWRTVGGDASAYTPRARA